MDAIRTECMEKESLGMRGVGEAVEKRRSHMRPRPGRRRTIFSRKSVSLFITVSLLFALCAPTLAASTIRQQSNKRAIAGYAKLVQQLGEVEEEILFDHRPAPTVSPPQPLLYRRQEESQSSNSSDGGSSTTNGEATQTSSVDSTTATGVTNAPLPKALDGGLGTNFTQLSCPTYLKSMVNNATLNSCLPFSLLLQNSMSFFDASRSLPSITRVLSASCNVDINSCSSLMSSFAATLRTPTACSDDFNRQNPMVRQTYNALLSYDVLYHTACLHATPTASNNQSTNFCFADSVTNTSSPTDSYIYYLALGVTLPGGSMPTCNGCLKDTMAIFANQAGNKTEPISLTYNDAAEIVNRKCGPNYVNASAPSGTSNNGSGNGAGSTRGDVPGLGILSGLLVATFVGMGVMV